jgi:hypothetical protein
MTEQRRYLEPVLIPEKSGIFLPYAKEKLSRKERWIYLLSDGKRTIAKIVKIMNSTWEEVNYILARLQFLGLVEVYPPFRLTSTPVTLSMEQYLGSRVPDTRTIIATDFRLFAVH